MVICNYILQGVFLLVYIHVPSAISTRNIDEMQRFYFDRGRIPVRFSGMQLVSYHPYLYILLVIHRE